MFDYILISKVLSKLDFPLWSLIKKDLGKDYLITYTDIEFLIMLNNCVSYCKKFKDKGELVFSKKETMKNILIKLDEFIKHSGKDFFDIYCDPYELFIDAGWINTKYKILL